MERRRLGSSGLEVSRIGLGTWAIGGHMWGGQDDAQSVEAIHAAVAHGINWIDTAPIYGSGHSEGVVRRAVKELPASAAVDLHEVRPRHRQRRSARSAAAAEVTTECEASLRRLGVERHRSLSAALARAAADCGNGRRVRRAAEGGEDSGDWRVELLGGAARRVARDRRTAALRSAAVQHPSAGREARRPAVVCDARRRRHLVLAALPRPAVRHLAEGQDVSGGRRPEHAQGLLRRALSSGIWKRSTRFARWRRAVASASRSCVSACCCTRRA